MWYPVGAGAFGLWKKAHNDRKTYKKTMGNCHRIVDLPSYKMLMIHSYVLPLPELPAKDLKAAHQSF